MASYFRPRISQAKELLPIIRAHLAAAAALHSLPAGLSIDLLPIVEDGLAGYEIVPNRSTYTYLTIGWGARGAPVLRESSYRDGPPNLVRVVAVDGESVSPIDASGIHRLRQRDSVYRDWAAAAEAAWSELTRMFPQEPRYGIELHDVRYEELDEALATAYQYLVDCDPCIDFCGVPDEVQYGLALTDAKGGRGQLVMRHPETWTLWFQSAQGTVHEEWMVPSTGVDRGWVRASGAPLMAASHDASVSPLAAASQHGRRSDRGSDRRHEDRRHADRRHTARSDGERRQEDRRRHDRRLPRPGSAPI